MHENKTLNIIFQFFQVGVFPKFSGEEYDNFIALAEKLRSDYDFAHTLNAKHLPKGDSSVSGPVVRLFKPFDELFVDSKVFLISAVFTCIRFYNPNHLKIWTMAWSVSLAGSRLI
jgi:hypothetical protein